MAAFFENLRSSLGIDSSAEKEEEDLVLEHAENEPSEDNGQSREDKTKKPNPAVKEQKKRSPKKMKEKQTAQQETAAGENDARQEAQKISVLEKESEEDFSEQAAPPSRSWFEPEGELAIDVYQTEDSIVVQTALAGVRGADLDISIENDVVTIHGMRKNPSAENKKYVYQECFWGPFSRQIILPEEVDASHSEAVMKDGVFTLRMPKLERVKVKKIKVQG